MKTERAVQQENIDELVKLQNENPDARVICFVSEDAVNDDYGYTGAEFGKPYLETLTLYDEMYRDEDDSKEYLGDTLYTDGIITDDMTQEEMEVVIDQKYEELGYEKVIVIYINGY